MNQRWTLHVENFARIDSADIEISPLMCFIGDNNSGKSYVMTLLWGIIANGRFLLESLYRSDFLRTPNFVRCNKFISENMDKTTKVTNDIEQMFVTWFNEILKQHKDELLRKIFNYEITADKIEIRNFSRTKNLFVHFWNATNKFPRHTSKENCRIFEMHLDIAPLENYSFILCWLLLMENLIDINGSLLGDEFPIYLPSSRTGFLLARREIASHAISNTFALPNENSKFQERFTAPYIYFLQILNDLKDSKAHNHERKEQLIEFLNDEIIHGTLKVTENGKIIRYLPEDTTQDLSMHITSSVVTETAALILLLTTRISFRLVIIEEPEAHLHPALQKKMAQLLIRLVNSGIPVWITTHSDTILQHFNNMIKLSNRSPDERDELLREFNYTTEDLLHPDEVHLYQFERGEQHTSIRQLKSGKYGFVAPTFNQAIDKLLNEIFAFQEEE